jgi:hypothetical protein
VPPFALESFDINQAAGQGTNRCMAKEKKKRDAAVIKHAVIKHADDAVNLGKAATS